MDLVDILTKYHRANAQSGPTFWWVHFFALMFESEPGIRWCERVDDLMH